MAFGCGGLWKQKGLRFRRGGGAGFFCVIRAVRGLGKPDALFFLPDMEDLKGMRTVFSVVSSLIGIYSVALWVRVLLTWLPSQRDPYHSDGPFVSFLKSLCDPFLNLFRSSKNRGPVDFSALWAFMTLNILQSVFSILARNGVITPWVFAALLAQGIWQYLLSFVLVLLCVLLLARYICGRFPTNPRCRAFLQMIDPVIRRPVNLVAGMIDFFVRKRAVSDEMYVLSALVFYVCLYFGIRTGLRSFVAWVVANKT